MDVIRDTIPWALVYAVRITGHDGDFNVSMEAKALSNILSVGSIK